jgi:hypothetical protein
MMETGEQLHTMTYLMLTDKFTDKLVSFTLDQSMGLNTLPIIFDGRRYSIGGIPHENVYGIVVFLDALGVKGIWKTKDPAEVLDNWNKVYYAFSDELSDLPGGFLSAFSDTLIFSIRGHKELVARPWRFVEILLNAIIPAFVRSMYYDFFFRGIISMGAFSRSSRSRMLIGPAVDEAAMLYEAAEWVGMSISPSTRMILQNSECNNTSNLIVEYPIPQKSGNNMTWAVNWVDCDSSFKCGILRQKILEQKEIAVSITL